MSKSIGRAVSYAGLATLGTLSRLAPDMLGQAAKKSLAKKLVQLRGVPLKISQILSMTRSENDEDLWIESQRELEPMPFDIVHSYLSQAQPEFVKNCESIEERGIPASLGQVHRVRMKDGRDLAVKVQYPDIDGHVDMDQQMIGLVGSVFDSFKEGFSMSDYRGVISAELSEELDYVREAQKQAELHEAFKDHPGIVVPRIHGELCGAKHIVQDWCEGMSFDEFSSGASRQEKVEVVKLLAMWYFETLFRTGFVHADPNPGNFALSHSPKGWSLTVYDYGSVLPFPKSRAMALLKLLKIVDVGDEDPTPWLVKLGFSPEPLADLRDRLLAFLDLLFEPFLCAGRYHLPQWQRGERAKDILGAQRWNFMVAAPADLLPFMRATQGLLHYANLLNVGIYLRPMLEDLWRDHKGDLDELEAPSLNMSPVDVKMAKNLCVHVYSEGVKKVDLSLPRTSIEDLENVMDAEVRQKLVEQGVDLNGIVRECRENGYRPREIFQITDKEKRIDVFLR